MLVRKIEKYLLEWKNDPDKNPLIIKGCRQCGQTYSVLDFAKKNYKHIIYINFFENLVADFLNKMGRKLYYFHKDSGLEIDFIIRYKGECTLLECKSTNGNTKSSKTVLKNYDKYHVNNLIKLGDYNIGRNDNITTLPLYLGFLIREL